MHHRLHIEGFALGDWMTNCYVLHVEGSTDCWIVDAGFEPQPLVRYVQENGLVPQAIIQTHGHVDHVAGIREMRCHWPQLPIMIHRAEAEFLTDPALNLSIMLPEPIVAPPATRLLHAGEMLSLAGLAFQVRHTPGHSPGGISLYQADHHAALVGDALFAGSVGRTDFPTSDPQALFESIRTQLLTLPDQTRVFPGHGPQTTIGNERRTNPFLR